MLANLLDKFKQHLIDSSMGQVSENTILAYMRDLKHFLGFVASRELNSITSDDIIKFTGLPNFRKIVITSPSISTRKRRLSSLRAFFDFLASKKIITDNPTNFRRLQARQPKRKPSYLKPWEVRELVDLLPNHILLRTIIKVLFRTGMRLSELRTCQVTSVDFKEMEIRVLGKGNKERYIPFSVSLSSDLKEYLTKRQAFDGVTEFFVSRSGKALSKNQIEYMFQKLSKVSGFHVTPHKLRHSFATDAANRGMPSRSLQVILGHESLVTTEYYTDIEPSVKDDYRAAYEESENAPNL